MSAFLILGSINLLLLILNIFNQAFYAVQRQTKKSFFFSVIEILSIFCCFFFCIHYFLLAKKLPNNSIELLLCLSFVIYFLFTKIFLLFFKKAILMSLIVSCYVLFLNLISSFGLFHLLNGKSFSFPLYSSIYHLISFFLILGILFYFCCYTFAFFYRKYFLQIKYKKKSLYFSKVPNFFHQGELIGKFLEMANLFVFIFLFSTYFIFLLNPKQIITFIGWQHFFLLISWVSFFGISIYQKIKAILPQYLFFVLSTPTFFLLLFSLLSLIDFF